MKQAYQPSELPIGLQDCISPTDWSTTDGVFQEPSRVYLNVMLYGRRDRRTDGRRPGGPGEVACSNACIDMQRRRLVLRANPRIGMHTHVGHLHARHARYALHAQDAGWRGSNNF